MEINISRGCSLDCVLFFSTKLWVIHELTCVRIGGNILAKEKIYIYHTNDLHSDFRFWPRINAALLKRRAQHERNGDSVFIFDVGDAADRAHPLIEATAGQAVTQLFNEAQYDAVTIGNNEGTTYSKDALNRLYREAKFSVLLTNIVDKETGRCPSWAEKYKIMETKFGAKIGVFALTEPIYEAYEGLGWTAKNPLQATEKFMEHHQHEADFWIVLSHLGLEEDQRLAERFPLALILGAHTHHALEKGEKIAGAWLAGAGSSGHYIGEVCLGYRDGKLVVEQVSLLDTQRDLEAVVGEKERNTACLVKGHELLSQQTIAQTAKTYEKALFENSSLMQLVLDATTDFAKTDVAFLNAGLLMGDLQAGKVTVDDLHRILPHPIRVMNCEIKGKDLIMLMEKLVQIDVQLQEKEIRGNGFRGEQFGKMCFKGITVKNDQVYWLNQPVEQERNYIFATVNYLSFFPIFDMLNTHTKQTVFFPELLREVVGNYLGKMEG